MTIGILHPGQMGAAIAAQARSRGVRALWCPDGRSEATVHRAQTAGLESVPSLPDLLAQADMVLSVCPPAFAEDLAREVARHGYNGVYADANAISPERAQRIATILPNATVVDGGIIGPPPTEATVARLYLSGPQGACADVAHLFTGTLVEVHQIGNEVGKASALKLSFASFQKATRALAAVSHALADHHGVREALQSEAERMGSSALAQPGYLPSVAARAWRWAPEMQEIAAALHEAGLPTHLAEGAKRVLEQWNDDKDAWNIELDEVFKHLSTANDETDR
ncbi:DUF1932 domain-containing protein [Glycomyces sp. L485]|uniref:NAD(P)-dependent oxidoreductase n=1 Tax=Glycomyces sp. L485 TaxID=2909235 RepID=UPI001F4A4814|nr:NAD(P)-dependent oxidoreductase [Glycomyces sp. L485]MCH7229985.1 DUF1932 domain-containing protein [Glycomyces sp. L485]